jgi:formamidopyrimidine-DNA glycosylase
VKLFSSFTSTGKSKVPELPEVEVVRRGIASALSGARVLDVEVRDGRALKRHRALGENSTVGHGARLDIDTQKLRAADFRTRLTNASFRVARRRGKFLWVPVQEHATQQGPPKALVIHLGMSGQVLLRTPESADERHVRVRLWVVHPELGELRIDFVDQRLFGSLAIDELVETDDRGEVPRAAAHIAPDPLETIFCDDDWVSQIRTRSAAIKTLMLQQGLASGIGNIYADEALWAARIHPATRGARISRTRLAGLLDAVREVFDQALLAGGTSFDSQYVNVNGQAGYFVRSLHAYGRAGRPCERCETALRRISVGGRGTTFCPTCQRRR